MSFKSCISVVFGVIGSFITNYLGGWDMAIDTLVMFMIVDYLLGLYVAGVLHNSPKTQSGGLSSDKGIKGLFKKVFILVCVALMYRLDQLFDIDYLRVGTIYAFMFQEGVSIIENLGLCGLQIPDVIKNGIDLLNKKGGDSDEN